MDDTISEKAYTDENEVNCWHYSHAKHRHVKGINILSCLVRYDDVALPIGYEIIKKDIAYCEIKTKKLKRKASISKNELFRQLIQQAVTNQVPFDYILADNWFGAKANMVFIQNTLKKSFVRAQCNHLFASMIAFCKLELLKIKTALNHFAIKNKLLLNSTLAIFPRNRSP